MRAWLAGPEGAAVPRSERIGWALGMVAIAWAAAFGRSGGLGVVTLCIVVGWSVGVVVLLGVGFLLDRE